MVSTETVLKKAVQHLLDNDSNFIRNVYLAFISKANPVKQLEKKLEKVDEEVYFRMVSYFFQNVKTSFVL